MKKMLKRALAVFVSMVIFLVAAIAPVSAKSFNDVASTYKYANEISSLVSLKLLAGYEDGSFKPDGTITRAEFSAVIARALGMDTFVTPTDLSAVFTDMTNADGSYHWSSGFVSFAYKKEIIIGMGDGTFSPDTPVTYEQAIKMIVCTLGYQDSAIDYGGWPEGYIQKGDELGITKDAIVSPTNTPASRGMVAKLIYNALEVNIAEKNSSGVYEETPKTLLNDKLKVTSFKNMMITEVDGEITINSSTKGIKKGEVLLESSSNSIVVSYDSIATSAELKSKLGYYISGYYRENDEEENVLVSIDTSSAKNIELSINSDNIDSYDNFEIEYWQSKTDSNTKEATLADDVKFIFNGMIYDYSNSSDAAEKNLSKWLNPESSDFVYGKIRLLDSDGNSKYDAIFMEDYDVYVVKSSVTTNDSIAANNYVVYDYYNTAKKITLDVLDESTDITIKNAKTNADVKIEALKAKNILSVAKSIDGSMYTCYVSTQTVNGEITSMSERNHIYTINGVDYKLTSEFEAIVEADKETLGLGTSGTFYIDAHGRIAAVNATAIQAGDYGYITIAALTGSTADVATIKLMPLTSSSKPAKVNLAPKVKINGKTCTSAAGALDALKEAASLIASNKAEGVSESQYSQPVRFIKNGAGEITNLVTVSGIDGKATIGPNSDKSKLQIGKERIKLLYKGSGKFSDEVFINSSTKIVIVPDDRSDDDDYKSSSGYSMFKTADKYDIEAYDIDDSGVAALLVVYGADTSRPITSDTKLCIVNGISTVSSNVTDGIAYSIEVYEDGILKSYETEDTSDKYKQISIGDIVRFGFNSDEQINDIKIALDCDNLIFEAKHDSTTYNGDYKFKTIFGTVLSKSDELIMIVPNEVVYKEGSEETPDNGEGEVPDNSEGETPDSSEGETPDSSEGETPDNGEEGTTGNGEGETLGGEEEALQGEETEESSLENEIEPVVIEDGFSLSESGKEGYSKLSTTKIYRVVINGGDVSIEAAPWDSIVAYKDVENDTASTVFAHAYNNNLKLVVVYISSK